MPENEVKVYILEHKMGVEGSFVAGFSMEHMVCASPKVAETPKYSAKMARDILISYHYALFSPVFA